MSRVFADVLQRLRVAVLTRMRGRGAGEACVQKIDLQDLLSEFDRVDRAYRSLADDLAKGGVGPCTCPTGDGSLRWPSVVHPPALGGQMHVALDPACAVIQYLLSNDCQDSHMEFLRCWNEGNFEALREWENVPDEVYAGADPAHPATIALLQANERVGADVTGRLVYALRRAKEWLEGWASAEPQLVVINAALESYEQSLKVYAKNAMTGGDDAGRQ